MWNLCGSGLCLLLTVIIKIGSSATDCRILGKLPPEQFHRDTSKEYYVKWYVIFYHCKFRFMSRWIYNQFMLNFILYTFLGWIQFNQNLGNFGLISIFIYLTCLVMGWDQFRSPSSENKCCSFSHRSIPDHMLRNYWYIFRKFQ